MHTTHVRLKIQCIMRLHNQEIMDWLADEFNEDAVIAYGEALPEHVYPDDMDLIKDVLNRVLKDLGSALRLLECVGQDSDGYIWRVKDCPAI